MAATSEVQICSNALLLLGGAAISSFTEQGTGPLLSSNLWPLVRDATLRSHPWNVAMKRVALAPDSNTPAFDWAYQFLLPGDCLRVWKVGRDGDVPEYRLESSDAGNVIMMDEATCYLRYVRQLTDVTKYDSLLTMALVAAMAANLAYPITKSQTQQDAMVKLYQFHLRQARTIDGTEDTPEEVGDTPLIAARVF